MLRVGGLIMTNIQALLNSQDGPNTLILMSGDQLNKLISEVTENTRRIVEEQFQPKYFTMDDMTSLFKVGVSTIYNWIERGAITPHYIVEGGKPYFDQAEIRDRMNNGLIGKGVRIKK